MANIFGTTPATIYLSNGSSFQLPKAGAGGREEDFIKEEKTWLDLNKDLQHRILGYRLECSYKWGYISSADYDNLVTADNHTGLIQIKFSTLPHRYAVRIVNLKHGLAGGFNSADAAEMILRGIRQIKSKPTPDLVYSVTFGPDPGSVTIDIND